MSKRRSWIFGAFLIVIIPLLLSLTGCPFHTDSLNGFKFSPDGGGGAIAIFEDGPGGDIFLQKISPQGMAIWGQKGVLLGSSHSRGYSYFSLGVVSDGTGGAIASWPEYRSSQAGAFSHIARIDSEGHLLWQKEADYSAAMVSDNAGGAILAFDNLSSDGTNKDLKLQRLDSQGNYPWGEQGAVIRRQNYQDNTLQIAADGSGGGILSWREIEIQPNPTPGLLANNTSRIFIQRINSAGQLLWGDSVVVETSPPGAWFEGPHMLGDGTGGAILSWFQVNQGTPNSKGKLQTTDILAQKVDAEGRVLWQPGGVALNLANSGTDQPAMAGDSSGGAILIWRDMRQASADGVTIFGQWLDDAGQVKWQDGGVRVSSAALNPHAVATSAGGGSSFVAYSFRENGGNRSGLHLQKLDSGGRVVWQQDGVVVTNDSYASHSLDTDGLGGAIAGWATGGGQVYLQRISVDGKLLWGEGIGLNR